MSSLALLLLLLCISLHACTPRPLTQKQNAKCLFHGELDKVLILEIFIAASKTRPCTSEENEVQQRKVAHDETVISESATLREAVIGTSNRYAGTEASASFQTDPPSLLQGQRRHTRSMLGPARHHVEETVNPNSGDAMENMVEMDYAQPHRKPPIHNEKP